MMGGSTQQKCIRMDTRIAMPHLSGFYSFADTGIQTMSIKDVRNWNRWAGAAVRSSRLLINADIVCRERSRHCSLLSGVSRWSIVPCLVPRSTPNTAF